MLFEMKLLEANPEEELTYQNPYPNTVVLIASSPEATNSETAFVVRHLETIAFRVRPGVSIYGRTRLQK